MQLTVFNGSPRGKAGNTEILLTKVIEGFTKSPKGPVTIYHLNNSAIRKTAPEIFRGSEMVLLGFPLYADAMPGLVKEFIESLAPYTAQENNPTMAFLVQSGFPEAHHSRFVERYLEKLALRLNAPYAGTIVKGGCEGVRLMPEKMNRKLFLGLQEMGRDLAQNNVFDAKKLKKLAKPEQYPRILVPIIKLLLKLPITQSYWDSQLKRNGAYEARFAKPFIEE